MLRLGVLISGGGSNLQSLLDAAETGFLKCQITMVIADRPAGGLERAHKAGVPALLLDKKQLKESLSQAIDQEFDEKVDMIVLAGFLSILSPEFIQKWEGKIINIHPSLLPDFGGKGMYGIHVHKAVLAAGESESGCTVHLVDSGIDTGRVLMQSRVAVLPMDTPESLQKRVLSEEHRILPEAIRQLADQFDTSGNVQ